MLIASLIVITYLLIGLYFRPYTLNCSLWERIVMHVIWLPLIVGLYALIKFGK